MTTDMVGAGRGYDPEDRIDPDALRDRLGRELAASGAVFVPPALVGAWATVAAPSHPRPAAERVHAFDASQCWCRPQRVAAAARLAQ